jgi:hypothetical protein
MLLLSGGACSAPASPPTTSADDAATDAALVDAPASLDPPQCEDDEDSVTCAPGKVCEVSRDDGVLRCVALDAGIVKPCGAVSCGWLCACEDEATSTCHCYANSGPLAPPDLVA